MPVNVTKEVKTNELHKGDAVIAGPNGLEFLDTALIVDHIDRKIKWSTVHFSNAAVTYRRLGDDVWTVVREEETQEERDEAAKRYYLRRLRQMTDSLSHDPTRALEEKIAKNREAGYLELLDYWTLNEFMTAQALYKIAVEVTHNTEQLRIHEYVPEAMRSSDDERLLTAWASWYLSNVLERRRYPSNPLSRSTSVLSNLFEDLDAWAITKIADDARYDFEVVLKARALELQQLNKKDRR